ncbi:hypothetical protein ACLF6K_35525 [Streptomyces xanthophaeus]|uniref:hypothetical protein n=1 Tax=Streptomyces xanthophaeus TaxID=67385 RepID=UPI0039901F9F
MFEPLEAFNSVVDSPVEALRTDRRPGEVTGAYTRSDWVRRLRGWQSRYSIAQGIEHSLRWAAVRGALLPPAAL